MPENKRLRRQTAFKIHLFLRVCVCVCVRVFVLAMEGNLHGGTGDVAMMQVKTEVVDENASALVVGSREPPAPCGDAACRGSDQAAEELAEAEAEAEAELQAAPVLLYPVSTDRFFTAAEDGKTYLKIAPATVMPPSDKMAPSGSDFSSKAVLCLIEAVGRRWGLYETRERSQLFQSVQEEMAAKGHVLPVEKIRRKWNNLIVTYKRVKDRSRETGHAKTSWEFFDLMEAMLSDTVGTQINNKRSKCGNMFSTLPGPLAKIAAKPPIPQSTLLRPNSDFGPVDSVDSACQTASNSQMNIINNKDSIPTMTSLATANISPGINAPELKSLIVLNGDIVTTTIPATFVSSPPFMSSCYFADSASSSPSLGSANNTDLNSSRFSCRKAPPFAPGVVPFRLSSTQLNNNQNLLSSSSSFSPPTYSSLPATSFPTATMTPTEGQSQKGQEEQSSAALLQEILKQQEQQAHPDRVARRRVEAREKRRERREVRMAESLGRIATAMELLSSKQDTVIALLQRLADRK
ncbi:uncharacterized protein LOC143014261 [Genypterus blacodes]|uniref:uncharacterized protein LOC143014261 n=1 Tax=Genypterus blacodes TaxID=154954 RepID=UPI003F75B916